MYTKMDRQLEVSIIVPAWNEEKVLTDMMNSVERLDYPEDKYEIIVVAGGDDNTYDAAVKYKEEMKDLPKLQILKQSTEGKNVAIQHGIEKSKGEIIVIIDADCIVEKNWLTELINPIVKENFDAVGGMFYPKKTNYISTYLIIQNLLAKFVYSAGGLSHGAGAAIKRSVIDNIKIEILFNRDIYTGIDSHMSQILVSENCKIKFVKEAVSYTDIPTTTRHFAKFLFRWIRSGYLISTNAPYKKIIFSDTSSGTISPIKSLAILGSIFGIFSYFFLKSTMSFVIFVVSLAILLSLITKLLWIISKTREIDSRITFGYLPGFVFLSIVLHLVNVLAFVSSLYTKQKPELKNFKGPR